MSHPNQRPRHVAVVVPARNEEERIGACLASVMDGVRHLRRAHPRITCDLFVVLDRCTDGTSAVAARHGALLVRSDAGRVGAARRLGARRAHARIRRSGLGPEHVWLANTDADTTVPDTWLTDQMDLAADGIDMVVGTVTPSGLEPALRDRWCANHTLGEGHSHVHGANLGVRLSAYLSVGGFADVAVHEDLDLVTRVRATTPRWVATHRTSVTTSGREQSRIEGGFASYLSGLGDATCAS